MFRKHPNLEDVYIDEFIGKEDVDFSKSFPILNAVKSLELLERWSNLLKAKYSSSFKNWRDHNTKTTNNFRLLTWRQAEDNFQIAFNSLAKEVKRKTNFVDSEISRQLNSNKNKVTEVLRVTNETLNEIIKPILDFSNIVVRISEKYEENQNAFIENKAILTPRPAWHKLSSLIFTGEREWFKKIKTESSEQLLQDIINYKKSIDYTYGNLSYLTGMNSISKSQDIPYFLKSDRKQIIKSCFTKREVLVNIQKLVSGWIQTGFTDDFIKYVHNFFKERQKIRHFSNNIYEFLYACDRFSNDERINLFLLVMRDEVDSAIYFNRTYVIGCLTFQFHKYLENHREETVWTEDMLKNIFNNTFIHKSAEKIELLVGNAMEVIAQGHGNSFSESIQLLIDQNDEGSINKMISVLHFQMEQERVDKLRLVISSLPKTKFIRTIDAVEAFHNIDKSITLSEITRYLKWIFVPGLKPTKSHNVSLGRKGKKGNAKLNKRKEQKAKNKAKKTAAKLRKRTVKKRRKKSGKKKPIKEQDASKRPERLLKTIFIERLLKMHPNAKRL